MAYLTKKDLFCTDEAPNSKCHDFLDGHGVFHYNSE